MPASHTVASGQVDIDARSAEMTVQLVDLNGTSVFTQVLEPRR